MDLNLTYTKKNGKDNCMKIVPAVNRVWWTFFLQVFLPNVTNDKAELAQVASSPGPTALHSLKRMQ